MLDLGAHREAGDSLSHQFIRDCGLMVLMLATIGPPLTSSEVAAGDAVIRVSSSASEHSSKSAQPGPMVVAQFQAHCMKCHGSDGRGTDVRDDIPTVPDFTDLKWQASRSDLQLRKSISEGTNELMPAMKRKLPPAAIGEMVVLVRRFVGCRLVVPDEKTEPPASPHDAVVRADNPPHPLPITDAQVAPKIDARAIYQRSCQLCHGADGRGASSRQRLPGIPDFTSSRWQQSRSRAKLVTSILEGKGEKMPSFRGKLDAAQVSALVTYIRAFDTKQDNSRSAISQGFDYDLKQLRKESEELRRAYRELTASPVDRPIVEHKR